MFYEYHLFFCINHRTNGKKCCYDGGAVDLCDYAKKRLKSLNLWGPNKIRVSSSGCLGRCELGPILVIYPDAVWYTYQTEQDIDEIIEKHLIQKMICERLRLKDVS